MAYQKIFTSKEFIERTKVAEQKKTLYILGCFGAPMGYGNNRKRYETNYDYNKQPERTAMIEAASDDTFGFDCVCLVKGIGWDWVGDTTKEYGGAKYASNGIEDMTIQKMRSVSEFSTDFSNIVPGEVLFFEDNSHVGIYVGDGMAIECTPRWSNGVQYTVVHNVSNKEGNGRSWYGHGKLPWIDYEADTEQDVDNYLINKWEDKAYECLNDVIKGHLGNGDYRKSKLIEIGESVGADGTEFWQNVQDLVNIAVIKYNWKTNFRLAVKDWSKSLSKNKSVSENCWLYSTKGYTRERAEALVKALKEKGYEFSIEVK